MSLWRLKQFVRSSLNQIGLDVTICRRGGFGPRIAESCCLLPLKHSEIQALQLKSSQFLLAERLVRTGGGRDVRWNDVSS